MKFLYLEGQSQWQQGLRCIFSVRTHFLNTCEPLANSQGIMKLACKRNTEVPFFPLFCMMCFLTRYEILKVLKVLKGLKAFWKKILFWSAIEFQKSSRAVLWEHQLQFGSDFQCRCVRCISWKPSTTVREKSDPMFSHRTKQLFFLLMSFVWSTAHISKAVSCWSLFRSRVFLMERFQTGSVKNLVAASWQISIRLVGFLNFNDLVLFPDNGYLCKWDAL